MLLRKHLAAIRLLAASALVVGIVQVTVERAVGHENHAPLPTKGVTIAGDTIMLSDKAREAIGLTTEKIEFGDIDRTVTVSARVELPWYAQAMITSLVPGKIDAVLVRPGETVVPGQELARLVSTELESLQLDLLQAKTQLELAHKLVDQRTALDQQGVIAGKSLLESQAQLSGGVSCDSDCPAEAPRARPGRRCRAASGTAGRTIALCPHREPGWRHDYARRCPNRANGEPD